MPKRPRPVKPRPVFLMAWREWSGLSQTEFGDLVMPPVDKPTVSRWEKRALVGEITVGILTIYAKILRRDELDFFRPPGAAEADPRVLRLTIENVVNLKAKR